MDQEKAPGQIKVEEVALKKKRKVRENEMAKTIIITFLVSCILLGTAWFFIGRSDIREIRQSFDTVNGDFEGVQRVVGEIESNADGFAEDISGIAKESSRLTDSSKHIEDGLGEVDGIIGGIAGQVDKVAGWNNELITLGRNIGNVAFELRRLIKESGD